MGFTLTLTDDEKDALVTLLSRGIDDLEYHSDEFPQDYGEADFPGIERTLRTGRAILGRL